MTNPDLQALAAMRHRMHQHQSSHRPLSQHYELIGLAGELAFCNMIGIEVDTSLKPQGSGGVNYTVRGYSINVYCAQKAYHLLVESTEKATTADIYILSEYQGALEPARLVGWATRDEVVSQEPRDIGGMQVMSHAIPREALRDMHTLIPYLYPDMDSPGLISLSGEIAFATRVLGDRTYVPQQQRYWHGYQFQWQVWRIKVITTHDPTAVLVPVGGIHASVYVLASVANGTHPADVEWHGFASAYDVQNAEVITDDDGTDYHSVPAEQLRPMSLLYAGIGAKGPDTIQADDREGEPDTSPVQSHLFGTADD